MLWIRRLTKRHLSSRRIAFWQKTLYEVATRHFKQVDSKDIDQFLGDAKKNQGTIYIIRHRRKIVGFGISCYRHIFFKKKKLSFLVLEAGCLDREVRGKHVLNLIGAREIIRYKFSRFRNIFRRVYAVGLCMSPQSYALYSMLRCWGDITEIPSGYHDLYDAILSAYCSELGVAYPGCGKPIVIASWVPISVNIDNSHSSHSHHSLEKKFSWEPGQGFPIIIPIDFCRIFILLKLLFIHQLNLFRKK
ncbi:MAG: hypothetical protein Q8L78_01750 [Coxiellaceae bacterium]|nr:hypothetical protein [Coxiellaceae bacterium]